MEGPAPSLLAALRRAPSPDGTIGFHEFMEAVLYDEEAGYYATSPARAGREGDFLTAPEVEPLFGAVVHDWIGARRRELEADVFHVVEVGSGRGSLAASMMEAARISGEEARWSWHLVERGGAPRAALRARFADATRVRIYADVQELPDRLGTGVFVANELFDNLPVRRVMQAGTLKEVRLRVTAKRIREVLVDADEEVRRQVEVHGIRLREGQSAEVCPGAVPLLESLLGRFDRGGAFLVFDYGGEAAEVSGDAAPNGTVAAHRGHTRHGGVYEDLGQQDVTAHVNFTPLLAAARTLGYNASLTTQSRFLVEHGLAERLAGRVEGAADDFERLRVTQLAKQLYHPEAMGETFLAFTGTRFPRKDSQEAVLLD